MLTESFRNSARHGKKRKQSDDSCSVGGAVLSGSSPRRARTLVRSGPGAAPAAANAAAGVRIASTGCGQTASSSLSATSVDSWAAHGSSVRHEPSPVECFS